MQPKASIGAQLGNLKCSAEQKQKIISWADRKDSAKQEQEEYDQQRSIATEIASISPKLTWLDKRYEQIRIRYNYSLRKLYGHLSKNEIHQFQQISSKAKKYINSSDCCNCTADYYGDGRSCYCSAGTKYKHYQRCKSLASGLKNQIKMAEKKVSDKVIQGLWAYYKKIASFVEVYEESQRFWAEKDRLRRQREQREQQEKKEKAIRLLNETQILKEDQEVKERLRRQRRQSQARKQSVKALRLLKEKYKLKADQPTLFFFGFKKL